MGGSSGGWTAVMAAVTGDRSELEGDIGTLGVSSAVQAAVAFVPTDEFPGDGRPSQQRRVAGVSTCRVRHSNLYRKSAGSRSRPVR